jgi:predicted transcriptional regulator
MRITEAHESPLVIRALDSELRRKILSSLYGRRLHVDSLAKELGIPQSTCTVNVQVLERAGLITSETVRHEKGAKKVCTTSIEQVLITLMPESSRNPDRVLTIEMPVGLFTTFDVQPTCGLVAEDSIIGFYDDPDSFLSPHRADAELLWFAKGYIEYRFPKNFQDWRSLSSISVSGELCSEFPGHNDDWPSDITMWINGVEIGTWTSPGDFGGRRGVLTPSWWINLNSQYGMLKTWTVTTTGSSIDGVSCGNSTLDDLELDKHAGITIRLGIKPDATNAGGLNLFGKAFGNYRQHLMLTTEFTT